MKSREEMRREARAILGGKWFMRLLVAGLLLQMIAYLANYVVIQSLEAMSITQIREYAESWAAATRQGLGYSLPTTKAYMWMIGGFCLQTFIAYVFGAIVMFGFMGLLLKALDNDDNRWMACSMSGFTRPLEVAWLMLLLNFIICLSFAACAALFAGGAALLVHVSGMDVFSPVGLAAMGLAAAVSVPFAMPALYAYRQAWYIKSEDASLTALECLRRSRRMMKGFKMDAFLLDFSYAWRFLLCFVLFAAYQILGATAAKSGAVTGMLTVFVGFAAFYVFLKTLFSMLVARTVLYREIKSSATEEGR